MPHQRLLFLDTNVMHYARLFLEFARGHNLSPCADDRESDIRGLLGTYGRRARDNLINGRKALAYLRGQCDQGARIEYSPVSRLELACGLLRGRALLDAAREGIPHRMWSRMDEYEMLSRIPPTAYEAVQRDTDGLEQRFQAVGVDIAETSQGRMHDVWSLARLLLGLVYLDFGDSMVYASAVLAEADELVTDDGYLQCVANRIENPGGIQESETRAYFEGVRRTLVELVSGTVGIDARDVCIPKAPRNWQKEGGSPQSSAPVSAQ